MTQLDNANPAQTPGLQGADPAAGAAGVGAAWQGQDDSFIRIPKDALSDFGGDWHEMARLAKQGREVSSSGLRAQAQQLSTEYGMSLSDVLDILKNQGAEPAAAEPQGQQGAGAPADTGNIFDPVQFKTDLVGEFQTVLEARDQKARQAATEAENKRRYQEAVSAEYAAADEFLKAHKIAAPKQGERSPKYSHYRGAFFTNLMEAKEAAIPSWVLDQNQRQAYFNQPATPEMLAAVTAQTKKDLQDFGMEMTADFANKQEPTAGVSLDHGPGASLTPPSGDSMSTAQLKEFVLRGLQRKEPGE